MAVLSSACFAMLAVVSASSTLVASEVIRAGDVIHPGNVETDGGAPIDPDDPVFGREVRRTVYAGQPVDLANTQAPRLVTRNQMVTVKYVRNGLEISMPGRALGEAAAQEQVSVLNLNSRQLVQGVVHEEGWVLVQ